jgi:hypothetical protein
MDNFSLILLHSKIRCAVYFYEILLLKNWLLNLPIFLQLKSVFFPPMSSLSSLIPVPPFNFYSFFEAPKAPKFQFTCISGLSFLTSSSLNNFKCFRLFIFLSKKIALLPRAQTFRLFCCFSKIFFSQLKYLSKTRYSHQSIEVIFNFLLISV